MRIVTRCSRRRLLAGWLALLVAAPSAAGCGGSGEPGAHGGARRAFVSREVRVAPRLIDLSIRSPALGRTAMVRLLTPDRWSSQLSDRRWPVLYLLHGCCDDYESWTRSTEIERVPELRKLLVVMPEAGPVGFYANWRDANGPQWETFHLTELRQILERDYGAGGRRAVAGLSMGGLGAIGYAARHPGYFKAAASFSGILHPLQDPDVLLGLFAAFTPDPRAIWGDPTRQHEIWARHDPTELAARLRGTALFVSAGDGRPGPFESAGAARDRTEPVMLRESRAFVRRLQQLQIPVHADFYGTGVHDWPYWERELGRALGVLLPPIISGS